MFGVVTTDEKIQLAIAAITAAAVLVAAVTAWIGIVNERKRTQPIVIAGEARGRHFADSPALQGAWFVDAYLTSEGAGPAFNVRFGVEFHGVRFPYRLRPDDPPAGNIQRSLQPRERRPPEGAWPILINSTDLFGTAGKGGPDRGRVYWARYENAKGQVWETRNPGDRSARLDIRRVRFPRLHEACEQRRRQKTAAQGEAWVRDALAALARAADDDTAGDNAPT